MRSSEAPAVAKLFKSIVVNLKYYNARARKNETDRYTTTTLRQKIANDSRSVLVAYDGLELVGFCFSRWDDYTIWLEWFGVSPKSRNRGVGRALLVSLEKTLKFRKAHKVWCDCRTSNLKSKNILMSSGYRIIGIVKKHWYGQDFILWHKNIDR